MASRSEQVLQALHTALAASRPVGATLLRNAGLPARVPAAGMMILRDGDPGEPEFLFSPPLYVFEHRAEVDLIVETGTDAERDAAFDTLKLALGAAIAADRTLGGLCDYVLGEAPAPLDLPVEGAEGLKAATVGVVLTYATDDPLN
ncbi:acyl-CoA transferase [Aliiruegeria sabulilitoris]|uniref:acyl-CoA transferase n=1 Tax=Aliiruegeria sabulilitoris TaxID=1510458 RepID=UPI000834852C|nr:acyl-CoA transferase [Aliiruegeria sabulilitoris]NDR57132.1 acyl-CoA transferase [Pseudoruegeria sp. M32A2M]